MMATSPPLYSLDIVDTLYEFDEPILFVAKVGFLTSLFLKTDEHSSGHEFLSCYVNDEHISALREGRISIRGAFDTQKDKYVVLSDESYNVLSEFKASDVELDAGRLPKPGLGIYPRFGECPDVMQERDALLSIYFRGADLNRESIRYSILMGLLSGVQSLARNVIAPPELRGLKSSTFDFLVGDPSLGSLMISIKEPTAHMGRLRQARERKNLSIEDVRTGVARNKDEFFTGMEELLQSKAPRGASEDIYHGVQHLLPSDVTPYTDVMFSTRKGNTFKRISISRERANAVRASHQPGGSGHVRRTGTIVEINGSSRTLLLRSRIGTVTTCAFERGLYDQLRKNPALKLGSRMQVEGELFVRVRRDYLDVNQVVELETV